ncbi:MAG TPA: thiolase family protein [Candidatus Binataceae bacterium]|nr:thiolase family protein [Candidatus Binataceae bacterium]
MRETYVVGVGMTPFGRHEDKTIEDLGQEALRGALANAGLEFPAIEMAFCGHAMQGTTAGQRVINRVGNTGIPIINVENACATGSTALYQAVMAVRSGVADVALAIGFEKMGRGPIQNPAVAAARPAATPRPAGAAPMPSMFSEVFKAHSKKYGTTIEQMARVSVKNHNNASLNPRAQYGFKVTLEDVLNARMVADPLTLLMCCPTSSGAAAAIVASAEVARSCKNKPVAILASILQSERPGTPGDALHGVTEINTRAAEKAYAQAGVKPGALDLIELHDCFAIAEIVHYENLGLCARGEGGKFAEMGFGEIGGKVAVSPSGGLLAKGHPLGATGIAQVVELVEQFRGESGPRQVKGAKLGLAHCQGFGGAVTVHILTSQV